MVSSARIPSNCDMYFCRYATHALPHIPQLALPTIHPSEYSRLDPQPISVEKSNQFVVQIKTGSGNGQLHEELERKYLEFLVKLASSGVKKRGNPHQQRTPIP